MGTKLTFRKFVQTQERSTGNLIQVESNDLLGRPTYKTINLNHCQPVEVILKLSGLQELKVTEFTCKTQQEANAAICSQYFPSTPDLGRKSKPPTR